MRILQEIAWRVACYLPKRVYSPNQFPRVGSRSDWFDHKPPAANTVHYGQSRLSGLFITRKSYFGHKGGHFTNFRVCHTSTGAKINKIDCGLLYLPNNMSLCWKKCLQLRNCISTPWR